MKPFHCSCSNCECETHGSRRRCHFSFSSLLLTFGLKYVIERVDQILDFQNCNPFVLNNDIHRSLQACVHRKRWMSKDIDLTNGVPTLTAIGIPKMQTEEFSQTRYRAWPRAFSDHALRNPARAEWDDHHCCCRLTGDPASRTRNSQFW